jgi:hypothetical protein
MQLNDNSIDKTLSFEDVLGIQYKNLKFTDILSASTVSALGKEPAVWHQSYRTALPAGVEDDYRAYKYAKFVSASGEYTYIGIPFVKQTSIIENASPAKRYTFESLTPDQERSLNAMLTASGIENFKVETI